jgi:hypothetical protein
LMTAGVKPGGHFSISVICLMAQKCWTAVLTSASILNFSTL